MGRGRLSIERALARLEATAVLPGQLDPRARLAPLLADPLRSFAPPSIDRSLVDALTPDPPGTGGRRPDRASPTPAMAAPAPPVGARVATVPSGPPHRARRRRQSAEGAASGPDRRRPAGSTSAAGAATATDRPGQTEPRPRPRLRPATGPVIVGRGADRAATAESGDLAPLPDLRRWADPAGPGHPDLRRSADPTGPDHPDRRAGPRSSDPGPTRSVPSDRPPIEATTTPGPDSTSTAGTSDGASAAGPGPRDRARPTRVPPAPGHADPDGGAPSGPVDPEDRPRSSRSLSLRDLGSAWTADSPADPPAPPDGGPTRSPEPHSDRRPVADLRSPPAGPGPDDHDLARISELAGADVDVEATLLTMIERGLRSEARRYGVDLEGWEIR